MVLSNVCSRSVNTRTSYVPEEIKTISVRFVHSIIGQVFSPPFESVLESKTCISVAPDCQPQIMLDLMTEPVRF